MYMYMYLLPPTSYLPVHHLILFFFFFFFTWIGQVEITLGAIDAKVRNFHPMACDVLYCVWACSCLLA